jgi:NAD(P)-dependent dehydrogenase (short-subunit alcohol dehydrogenase family)
MTGRLQDKVAIITGAGSVGPGWGNGRATAVLFAREGAKVFAADKNGDSMKETVERVAEFGGTIKTHECDVTRSGDVKAMIDACLAAFGRIDILVNNVGGSAPGGPVELSEEAWDGQMNYNLKSVFLACKHVLPIMEKQGGGAIVNLASTSGLRYTGSPQVGYAASKAGVIQFSRVVAVQYANKGPREHGRSRAIAHADGRSATRQAADGRRHRRPAEIARGTNPSGLHGRRPRHRQCGAVSRFRRSPLRHRHRDRGRWRHGRALRLTFIAEP